MTASRMVMELDQSQPSLLDQHLNLTQRAPLPKADPDVFALKRSRFWARLHEDELVHILCNCVPSYYSNVKAFSRKFKDPMPCPSTRSTKMSILRLLRMIVSLNRSVHEYAHLSSVIRFLAQELGERAAFLGPVNVPESARILTNRPGQCSTPQCRLGVVRVQGARVFSGFPQGSR